MENKINIAELLKDCPKGMELDCTCADNVVFDKIIEYEQIKCVIGECHEPFILDKYGRLLHVCCPKCVIFPKGKTTWEGFVPPCKFEDGDILYIKATFDWVCIYKENKDTENFYKYVAISPPSKSTGIVYDKAGLCRTKDILEMRIATKEEKQKLFNAIKENGYKWDNETKTLVKLVEPKFKIEKGKWYVCIKDLLDNYANKAFCKGDTYYSPEDGYLIPSNSNVPSKVEYCIDEYFRDWTIQDAKDGDVLAAYECLVLFRKLDGLNIKCYCTYHFMNNLSFYVDTLQNKDAFHPATKEEKQKLFDAIKANGYRWNAETKTLEKLVEPKFKVGNRIKKDKDYISGITDISDDGFYKIEYQGGNVSYVSLAYQDDWELVPNKFDINTLKPFESRVLVRDTDHYEWEGAVFGRYDGNSFFTIGGVDWRYCIPYEGNEHLFGSTNDCNDFYKTWEK